ncbi:MAG: methylated-DNA--[protein]-cysteine S-methyltransferase [Kineosporiaceae bacterium]
MSMRVPGEAEDVARLSRALARRADAEGLLDVAWDEVNSPFGTLAVCATATGVVRVVLPNEDRHAALAAIAALVSPRLLRAPDRLDAVRAELGEYFAGRRRSFDVPVDWRLTAGFRRLALAAVAEVPYGSTASYRDIAGAAGNPRATRAAGSACATNPTPIVVPCHRVLRADGALGGYLGGPAMKASLLELERGRERAA